LSIKIVSKRDVGEERREVVDGLVERKIEGEVFQGIREIVHGVIEMGAEGEVGETRGEIVHWEVKILTQLHMSDRERKIID
jgi:hypothetical protein